MNRNPIHKISVRNLNFYYGDMQVLKDVNADFEANTITAVTGPSGRGKSSFLTVINRLWESIPDARAEGSVRIVFDNEYHDINNPDYPLESLRRKVGMVFQMPNPLPMSIYKNICFPLKIAGFSDKTQIPAKVEKALKQSFLWDEVKDRLNDDARALSGGQQQRLCIARALILEPEILLLDEPASSLDATAASVIEDLIISLKETCTLIVVSHYLSQVNTIADRVFELADGTFAEKKKPKDRYY
jgi:phosphate transport system ATP-binding protein